MNTRTWSEWIRTEWEEAIVEAETPRQVDDLMVAARQVGELGLVLADGQRLESRLALRRRQLLKADADAPPAEVEAAHTSLVAKALNQATADLALSSKRRLAAVRDARNAGWSNSAIGRELGVSEAAVRRLLRRNTEVKA